MITVLTDCEFLAVRLARFIRRGHVSHSGIFHILQVQSAYIPNNQWTMNGDNQTLDGPAHSLHQYTSSSSSPLAKHFCT